jgi:hypothetical protein
MARKQTGRKYLKLTQFSFDVENSFGFVRQLPQGTGLHPHGDAGLVRGSISQRRFLRE